MVVVTMGQVYANELLCRQDNTMQRGVLGTSAMQRRWAQFSLNEQVSVKPYNPFATGVDIYLAMLKVEVGFLRKSAQNTDDFDTEKMSEAFSNVRLYKRWHQMHIILTAFYSRTFTIKSFPWVNCWYLSSMVSISHARLRIWRWLNWRRSSDKPRARLMCMRKEIHEPPVAS